MQEQAEKIEQLPDDVPDEERDFHEAVFAKCEEQVERRRKELEHQIAIDRAWQKVPEVASASGEGDEPDPGEKRSVRIIKEPSVYRPDVRGISFFQDIYNSVKG